MSKAWKVWRAPDEIEWFVLLFAETRGQAKYRGMGILDIDWFDYTEMRCRRIPQFDGGTFNDRALFDSRLIGWSECGNCGTRIGKDGVWSDDSDDDVSAYFDADGNAFCSAGCHRAYLERWNGQPPMAFYRTDHMVIGQD